MDSLQSMDQKYLNKTQWTEKPNYWKYKFNNTPNTSFLT